MSGLSEKSAYWLPAATECQLMPCVLLDDKILLLLKKDFVKKCRFWSLPKRRLQTLLRTVFAGLSEKSTTATSSTNSVARPRRLLEHVERKMTTRSSYFSVQSDDEPNISKSTSNTAYMDTCDVLATTRVRAQDSWAREMTGPPFFVRQLAVAVTLYFQRDKDVWEHFISWNAASWCYPWVGGPSFSGSSSVVLSLPIRPQVLADIRTVNLREPALQTTTPTTPITTSTQALFNKSAHFSWVAFQISAFAVDGMDVDSVSADRRRFLRHERLAVTSTWPRVHTTALGKPGLRERRARWHGCALDDSSSRARSREDFVPFVPALEVPMPQVGKMTSSRSWTASHCRRSLCPLSLLPDRFLQRSAVGDIQSVEQLVVVPVPCCVGWRGSSRWRMSKPIARLRQLGWDKGRGGGGKEGEGDGVCTFWPFRQFSDQLKCISLGLNVFA